MQINIEEQKRKWLLEYMNRYHSVDVANKTFVERYSEEFDCLDMGKYLSKMFKEGILERVAYGLPDRSSDQPKWVYVYKITGT